MWSLCTDAYINIRMWSTIYENVVSVKDEDVVSVRENVVTMTWSSVDDAAANCV